MSMANKDQEEMWNGVGGKAWVRAQTLLDTAFQPFADILVQTVTAAGATSVLDIGCGTGATTLAMAEALGPEADCLGLDISETMITHARKRAAETGSTAEFIVADAQTHPFEAGRFDMITSRFGVMFFEDSVAAFRNLNRAAQPGTTLTMFSWRGPEENRRDRRPSPAARPAGAGAECARAVRLCGCGAGGAHPVRGRLERCCERKDRRALPLSPLDSGRLCLSDGAGRLCDGTGRGRGNPRQGDRSGPGRADGLCRRGRDCLHGSVLENDSSIMTDLRSEAG